MHFVREEASKGFLIEIMHICKIGYGIVMFTGHFRKYKYFTSHCRSRDSVSPQTVANQRSRRDSFSSTRENFPGTILVSEELGLKVLAVR